MGDISLPHPETYYRITWTNGLYSNRLNAAQVQAYRRRAEQGLTDADIAKVELIMISVEVHDIPIN